MALIESMVPLKADIIKSLRDNFSGATAGLSEASTIVGMVYRDQKDKRGQPLVLHLFSVSEAGRGPEQKATALLHDLPEDTHAFSSARRWTANDLTRLHFPGFVVQGVRSMTRRPDEPYFDYIQRTSRNRFTLPLKMKDIDENGGVSRQHCFLRPEDPQVLERQNRYYLSWNYLSAVDQGLISGGLPVQLYIARHAPYLFDRSLLQRHSSSGIEGIPESIIHNSQPVSGLRLLAH